MPRQHLTPGKDPVPIVQEAGWAPGPVWTGGENFAPPGFDPRTVQPVGSRYTDYATRPTSTVSHSKKNKLYAQFIISIFRQTPLHISGVSIVHHQEVHRMDTTVGTLSKFCILFESIQCLCRWFITF